MQTVRFLLRRLEELVGEKESALDTLFYEMEWNGIRMKLTK